LTSVGVSGTLSPSPLSQQYSMKKKKMKECCGRSASDKPKDSKVKKIKSWLRSGGKKKSGKKKKYYTKKKRRG